MGNDFRRSAVSGLSTKLAEIRKDTEQENAEGFALVIGRSKRVNDWVNQNYTFGSGSSSRYNHNDAGYSAGRRVSLSAGVGSSGSTKRLGGE